MRHDTDRTCDVCGASLDGMRRDARYCSNACKQAAYRQRKRAEEQAERSLWHRVRAWLTGTG